MVSMAAFRWDSTGARLDPSDEAEEDSAAAADLLSAIGRWLRFPPLSTHGVGARGRTKTMGASCQSGCSSPLALVVAFQQRRREQAPLHCTARVYLQFQLEGYAIEHVSVLLLRSPVQRGIAFLCPLATVFGWCDAVRPFVSIGRRLRDARAIHENIWRLKQLTKARCTVACHLAHRRHLQIGARIWPR
jgi:hypothetical protein